MARSYARLYVSTWSQEDFRDLSVEAQHLYMCLLAQPQVNTCGVAPLMTERWARLARNTSPEVVAQSLTELRAGRFLLVDDDTGEVLIRTFVKHDDVLRSPNLTVAMTRDYTNILSPKLRSDLLDQLGEGFHQGLPKGLWERFGEPFRKGYRERFGEPIRDGSAGARRQVRGASSSSSSSSSSSPPRRKGSGKGSATNGIMPPSDEGSGRGPAPGGGGIHPRAKPPPDLLERTLGLVAEARLAAVEEAAAAGEREPIRNRARWLETANEQLRDEIGDDLTRAWDLTGAEDPAELAAAWERLPRLLADEHVNATEKRLAEERSMARVDPAIVARLRGRG